MLHGTQIGKKFCEDGSTSSYPGNAAINGTAGEELGILVLEEIGS